jgi:L-ascorbate metabolism protein UlaG (beta-lactamase superfamily)
MITLRYHGLSCFEFQAPDCTIITDPFDSEKVAMKRDDLPADVVIASKDQRDLLIDLSDVKPTERREEDGLEIIKIKEAGEYEVGGVFVRSYAKPFFHVITLDDLNVGYLGMSGSFKALGELDDIGQIDYLIVPVGDEGSFVSWKLLGKLIKKVDPAYVIPSCYKQKGVKKALGELKELDEFLKEFGGGDPKPKPSLRMSSVSRSEEDQQYKVVVMKKR